METPSCDSTQGTLGKMQTRM